MRIRLHKDDRQVFVFCLCLLSCKLIDVVSIYFVWTTYVHKNVETSILKSFVLDISCPTVQNIDSYCRKLL
jgi:hypothetical protein